MEEIIDVVDEKDRVIGTATKNEMIDKALLHRAARVIILNSKDELLVHKRHRLKKVYPSHWDIGIAETVQSGETFEDAATRGLNEELGISDVIGDFLFKTKFLSPDNNAILKVFEAIYDGEIKMQEDEVEEAKFLPLNQVVELSKNEKFSPTGKFVLGKYIELKK